MFQQKCRWCLTFDTVYNRQLFEEIYHSFAIISAYLVTQFAIKACFMQGHIMNLEKHIRRNS